MTPREAGFTLIESLVALALGAMVVSAVLSTVRVAAMGAKRATSANAEAEAFARAGTVLAGDADHALWLADGSGRPVFLGLSAAMDLPETPRPTASLPEPPVLVAYRLEADATGTRLMRAEARLDQARAGAWGAGVELWRADHRLEFRFLDSSGAWLAEWSAQDRLPRAFALTDPAKGNPLLVAALPDLLPAACALGPGPACPLPAGEFQ